MFILPFCCLDLFLFIGHLLLFSCDWKTIFSVVFGFLFLLCVSTVDFRFAINMRFYIALSLYIYVCVYTYTQNCFKLLVSISNAFLISYICTLFLIAGFDIRFVCGWLPIFIGAFIGEFPTHNFLVSSWGLFFSI